MSPYRDYKHYNKLINIKLKLTKTTTKKPI